MRTGPRKENGHWIRDDSPPGWWEGAAGVHVIDDSTPQANHCRVNACPYIVRDESRFKQKIISFRCLRKPRGAQAPVPSSSYCPAKGGFTRRRKPFKNALERRNGGLQTRAKDL